MAFSLNLKDVSPAWLALDVTLGIASVYLVKRTVEAAHRRQSLPLPPGPKPLPIIGNLLDLPSANEYEWLHWAKYKELYGPISSVTVLGKQIIILNDLQVAFDLFDKRSAKYSDRPILTFGGEMSGWDVNLALVRYGERVRSYRRYIHQFMGNYKSVERFYDFISLEARRLLFRLEDSPDNLVKHLRAYAAAIILNMAYGYTVNQKGPDPLVDLADEATHQFSEAMIPGRWMVDTLPFLKHMPEWFPGAGFKRTAKRFRQFSSELQEKPFAFVKRQLSEGQAHPSYIGDFLMQDITDPEEIHVVKHSAASLYAGGSDTTVSVLHSFILAMILYPNVQRKAQVEIGNVVGSNRLPTFEDRPNLPYVDAIVTEALRWNPVLPMGFPHVTSEDDIYQGYFIPKGAPVMPNVWLFTHDPAEYEDPMNFKPERFLTGGKGDKKPERDPREMIFGFGRRECPGRILADVSAFIAVAMMLTVFDIKKPLDADGNEVEPLYEYNAGLLSHPKDFKCRLIPRTPVAAGLIRSIEEEFPFVPGDMDKLKGLKWKTSDTQ